MAVEEASLKIQPGGNTHIPEPKPVANNSLLGENASPQTANVRTNEEAVAAMSAPVPTMSASVLTWNDIQPSTIDIGQERNSILLEGNSEVIKDLNIMLLATIRQIAGTFAEIKFGKNNNFRNVSNEVILDFNNKEIRLSTAIDGAAVQETVSLNSRTGELKAGTTVNREYIGDPIVCNENDLKLSQAAADLIPLLRDLHSLLVRSMIATKLKVEIDEANFRDEILRINLQGLRTNTYKEYVDRLTS